MPDAIVLDPLPPPARPSDAARGAPASAPVRSFFVAGALCAVPGGAAADAATAEPAPPGRPPLSSG